jgi:hypothetical protein
MVDRCPDAPRGAAGSRCRLMLDVRPTARQSADYVVPRLQCPSIALLFLVPLRTRETRHERLDDSRAAHHRSEARRNRPPDDE